MNPNIKIDKLNHLSTTQSDKESLLEQYTKLQLNIKKELIGLEGTQSKQPLFSVFFSSYYENCSTNNWVKFI